MVTVVTHVSHSITCIVWTLFHGGDVVATCELVSFVVVTYYFTTNQAKQQPQQLAVLPMETVALPSP